MSVPAPPPPQRASAPESRVPTEAAATARNLTYDLVDASGLVTKRKKELHAAAKLPDAAAPGPSLADPTPRGLIRSLAAGSASAGAATAAGSSSTPLSPPSVPRPRPPRHPPRGVDLLRLLTSALDEFAPWLKWKLYDALLAALLLYLVRRTKSLRVRAALEWVADL